MSQKNEFENLEDKKIKHSYIQNMFSDISHTYDLMNNIFTFGQHKKWRKKIVKQEITQNDSVLDIGCGTDDFVFDNPSSEDFTTLTFYKSFHTHQTFYNYSLRGPPVI